MEFLKKVKYKKLILMLMLMLILLTVYIIINIIYLTKFPFVHSDESWLSGLSRNIAEKADFSVTETFFNLKIRNPHAIKIIFHSMQILMIKLSGYSIFSVRLLSLIFGILALYYQYKLSRLVFVPKKAALISVILLGVDVQFIYASHFARQEIMLLFVLVFALYYFFKNIDKHNAVSDVILASVLGLGIGLHPNSFIISLPFGAIYIYHIFVTKKIRPLNLLYFILTLALFAALFVSLSFYFDPDFISNYAKYGNEFEILSPLSSKFLEIKDFYLKLYYSVSGTYYTPDIRFQFFLFGGALLFSILKLYKNKGRLKESKIPEIIISIVCLNAGIIFIGRYNQTSIAFQFPLFYILVCYAIENIKRPYKNFAVSCLVLIVCCSTVYNVLPYLNNDYSNYLFEISKAVNKNDAVLANLNTEYYFDNGRLYDYRNLAFLKDSNMSFKDYIQKYKIQYIIYPEEMDLIYSQRPKWNGIYGNLLYYDEMKQFFINNCELVHEFENKTYGIRIARYINTKDWNVKIYKVLN